MPKNIKNLLKNALLSVKKTGNVLNNKAKFERFDKMGAKAQKSGKSLHSMVISI